jgi:hypothetical protein
MGMEIRLAHPEGYGPNLATLALAEKLAAANGGKIVVGHDPKQLAPGSDALYTDVWVSMGQEDQSRDRLAAFAGYCIDIALLEQAGPDAVAMHCLPAHREPGDHGRDTRRSQKSRLRASREPTPRPEGLFGGISWSSDLTVDPGSARLLIGVECDSWRRTKRQQASSHVPVTTDWPEVMMCT